MIREARAGQRTRGGPPPLPLPPVPGSTILNPAELDRFKNLLIFARSTVEGYFAGKHPSRKFGSSAEFAGYREYSAGDDTSNLDWRVYARNRRLYLRLHKEETDMVGYLVVDASGSMCFSGDDKTTKFQQAAKIAAALAYLMVRQGDKVALALFAEKVGKFLPSGGTRGHLHKLVTELEQARAAAGTLTAQALAECVGLFRKRGQLIVLSDFLGDPAATFDALAQFVHRGFDILLLQVLDPHEINLPDVELANFVDMETGERLSVEPDEIRIAYRRRMDELVRRVADQSDRQRIAFTMVGTREPYIHAIEAYLGFRERTRSIGHGRRR